MIQTFGEQCPKCHRPREIRIDRKAGTENAKVSERCIDRAGCIEKMRKAMKAKRKKK